MSDRRYRFLLTEDAATHCVGFRCALCGARQLTGGSVLALIVEKAREHLMNEHALDVSGYRAETVRRELWLIREQ